MQGLLYGRRRVVFGSRRNSPLVFLFVSPCTATMADRKSANLARNSLRIAVVVIEATRRSKTPVYEKGHTRRREQEDDEL
jgi:hypothetical protein